MCIPQSTPKHMPLKCRCPNYCYVGISLPTLIPSHPTFLWGIEECEPTSSYHFLQDVKSISAPLFSLGVVLTCRLVVHL